MTRPSDEAVARMETLVRNMTRSSNVMRCRDYVEARAIVAMLPEPVDPDVLACREIVARANDQRANPGWIEMVRDGTLDDHVEMKIALAAYRAGKGAS